MLLQSRYWHHHCEVFLQSRCWHILPPSTCHMCRTNLASHHLSLIHELLYPPRFPAHMAKLPGAPTVRRTDRHGSIEVDSPSKLQTPITGKLCEAKTCPADFDCSSSRLRFRCFSGLRSQTSGVGHRTWETHHAWNGPFADILSSANTMLSVEQ